MKTETPVRSRRRRPSAAFVASVVVHVFVAVALMRILVLPRYEAGKGRNAAPVVDRIGFLRLTRTPGAAPAPGHDGGNGRPISKTAKTRPRAPTSVPTVIPPISSAARVRDTEDGTGPLVGTGGPARGIKPVFSDPRVWAPPGKIASAPRTLKQDLDSIIASSVGQYNDSIGAIPATPGWEQGDWTVEKNGRKYGIDPHFIRLGPVSIPTALLALLPLNITSNPMVAARQRAMNYMNRDISEHAQQAINQADFNKAVRSIRERKERERAALGLGADSSDR